MTRTPDDARIAAALAEQLRADARRNRERLLAAATAAFAEHGADAPLEDIARRAGVGIGTLYRHFPTRLALQEGVFRSQVARSAPAARAGLATRRQATRSPPGSALWPATWPPSAACPTR